MGKVNVALVGATGLVGEAILKLLEERRFPVDRLYLLASEESAGKRLGFADGYLKVAEAATFDYGQVQLVFMAVPPDVARQEVGRARAAGCRVIDFSAASRDDAAVPILVAGVNDDADALGADLVASPAADVTILAHVLSVLAKAGSIRQIIVDVQASASSFGMQAVQELASQSIALFNMKELSATSLGSRMAFNVLDLEQSLATSENRREFADSGAQLARIEPSWQGIASVHHKLTPVFHGMMLDISVIYDQAVAVPGLNQLIKQSEYLQLASDKDKLHDLSILTYGSGTDFVYIGTIRPQTGSLPGIRLTVVGDNVRTGAALNGVLIGEKLLAKPA